jgi:hypothetical protein
MWNLTLPVPTVLRLIFTITPVCGAAAETFEPVRLTFWK